MKGEFVVKPIKVFVAGLLISGLLGIGQSFSATASHTTRTDSGGGVTVKVTFLDSKGTGDLRFQVVLDTHSVDLDGYDLKGLAVLLDEAGKTYLPATVENKGGGHHRQVMMTFPKSASQGKRIEMVIKDIAGVKERKFLWEQR